MGSVGIRIQTADKNLFKEALLWIIGLHFGQNRWFKVGLHNILHAIVMRISSVKPVRD